MDSKEILRDLIKFNTINDKENKEIINYIENYLKEKGFKTEYKSKCLVMSNKEECEIGFLGHTDTVPYSNDWLTNPFELKEEDGKLYGLGTCDMKGSIAAILSVVSKINLNKYEKGIKLYFTYDEEIGFSGIRELVDKVSFPKYMIIGEPTYNEIINSSKGLLELKVSFNGISSHASKPEEGISAIQNCVNFINELNIYYEELRKEIINDKYATMNIGIINGGTCSNSVPSYCEITIDFRTVIDNQNKKIIDKVNELIKKYDSKCYILNSINPFTSDRNINISDYITEASFINSSNKYILGVGPVNPHKTNEFIEIRSLNKLEEQYINLIKEKLE